MAFMGRSLSSQPLADTIGIAREVILEEASLLHCSLRIAP